MDRQPEWAEWLNNIGGVKFRLVQYQETIDYYDRALALNPEFVQSQQMRTKALMAMDRVDEIVEEAREALDKSPDEPERHLYLALVERQAEQFQQAEATLNVAIDRFPDRDDIKHAFINLLMEQQAHWRAGLRLKDWVEEREEPD